MTLNYVELLFNVGGKESVKADFPEQPLGPAITGSAPDGAVGIDYAGYTYTTTPGDAPIVRTVIHSGALPAGLTWNQTTATISATKPQTYGTFTLTLRTYDANGLYADHTDTFAIAVPMLAYGATSAVSRSMLVVPSATDWSGSLFNTATGNGNLLGIEGGRFLSWDTGTLSYSDDFFATSTDSASSLGGAGGVRNGASRGGVVVIGGGLNGMYRSTDRGITFTQQTYPANPRGQYVAVNAAGLWATITQYQSDSFTSSNDASSWDTKSAHGISLASGGALIAVGEWFALGGKDSDSGKPIFALTKDFTTFSKHVLSAATGDVVTAVAGRINEGVYEWVIGTDDGQLFKSDGTAAPALVTDPLGVVVNKILFNGTHWIAGGGTGGAVKTSTDRDNWTAQTQPFGYDVIDLALYVP